MSKFIIKWPAKVNWRLKPSWSKNAVLPIMAASLMNVWVTKLTNVPDISDVWTMIKIFEYLNAKIEFKNNVLIIDASKLENKEIPHEFVCKLRWAMIILWPLLARFWEVNMWYPWGCVLWKRPVDTHLQAFEDIWCKVEESNSKIVAKKWVIWNSKITLKEISVTATENIVAYAANIEQTTKIRLCAAEPHVQDFCDFLVKLWAEIKWIWTHSLEIKWKNEFKKNVEHRVTSDYLEIGTFAIAAAITWWHLIIEDAHEDHLDSFWLKMKEAGVKFEHRDNEVEIFPTDNLNPVSIKTWVFPTFATDLQAPFSLIQCKAAWVSKVFETLFEKRLNYLFELEKMWVHIELLNPHQAMIIWWKKLKAIEISSCDIRAWAAMVLAALIADWETVVNNINYIDRGYENLDVKLRNLWVDIKRVDS